MVKRERKRLKSEGRIGHKLPSVIYAEASVKSVGGTSLFDFQRVITSENVTNFYSEADLVNSAVKKLHKEGFEVLQTNRITINIAGPPDLYRKVFKTKLVTEEKPVIKAFAKEDTATFIDTEETETRGLIDTSKSSLANELEGVAIEEPVYYFQSYLPPARRYWYLDVPAEVSVGMDADRAHRTNFTGRGIKVVMVDSGWYRHPFFTNRGYRSSPTVLGPATANPDHDENGHGTGESANVFAVAPDVDFTMVKINFVNSVGAFNTAVGLQPHIISCSWGSSIKFGPLSAANQILAASIANAVIQGIIIVFSAGNGHWGFPGQHPDVISAGGVYMHENKSFEATPYASGFASNIYPGRNVPDCCGLVGLPPGAKYIMLPVEPNNTLDNDLSGGTHPNGDETPNNDGWAAFSGTSAAAPQLAGICALIKQACSRLSPSQVRNILRSTARDVTAGNCHPNTGGHPAVPGPDLATGTGLADAFRAALIARLHCIIMPLPPISPPSPVMQPAVLSTLAGKEQITEEMSALEEMILELGR
jgi:subtilisin family serine protease